jgi:hypothetical protein
MKKIANSQPFIASATLTIQSTYVYLFEESQAYEGTYQTRVFFDEQSAMDFAQLDYELQNPIDKSFVLQWEQLSDHVMRSATGPNQDEYGSYYFITKHKVNQ